MRPSQESLRKLTPTGVAPDQLFSEPVVRTGSPVIRIEGGAFVGYLESQQYRLGPTREGIVPAVRKMIRLSSEDRLGGEIATGEIA